MKLCDIEVSILVAQLKHEAEVRRTKGNREGCIYTLTASAVLSSLAFALEQSEQATEEAQKGRAVPGGPGL